MSESDGIKAVFLDLSGVIYDGDTVIRGSTEALAEARRRKLVLRFVTNTATRSCRDIRTKLKNLGVAIAGEELFTAPMAARRYIRQRRLRPYCLVHRALCDEFASIDQQDPDCVLLGDARDDLSYAALNRAFRLCKAGAPLIGIGMNRYFRDEEGLKLDAGAFIHALAWAAETEPVIFGKPSAAFFDEVVASTPHAAGQCLMVGDDAEADVTAAMRAGLHGCLVRTGKYQPGDEDKLPAGARVIDSLAELLGPASGA